MTITIDATFEGGVLKPKQPLALDEGTDVRIVISTEEEIVDPLEGLIGICDGPSISLAERHDEILYGMTKQVPK